MQTRPETKENTYEIPESERNSLIQSARNCIEIKTDTKCDQHIIATRDINIGEVLVVEKPYAWAIFDHLNLYCHGCFKLCRNVIPCPTCVFAVYCTDTCKENAFTKYHQYECILQLYIRKFFDDIKETVIFALKMTFLARTDRVADIDASIYRSDRYYEFLDLDISDNKYPVERSFVLAFIAAAVFKFAKEETNMFSILGLEDEFKELFLFNLHISTVYCREIHLHCVKGDDDHPGYSNAIYSLISLFKHSCSPNAFCYSSGSTLIVRSVSTIKKGNEVCISYG